MNLEPCGRSSPATLSDQPVRAVRLGDLDSGARPRRAVPTGLLTGQRVSLPWLCGGRASSAVARPVTFVGKEVNQVSKLRRISARMRLWWNAVDGQGLAEYALILGLIAIVAIVALLFMGQQVSSKLSVVGSTIQSVQ